MVRAAAAAARPAAWMILIGTSACTIVRPIPPAGDDLYLATALRPGAAESCTTSGSSPRACLIPAVPLDRYYGSLPYEIWRTDLLRHEYAGLGSEKTNLGSLYNAMLWPIGAYVGARTIADPSTSLVRDAGAFALAAYGVLSAGVPDRDRLYLEASRQLACATVLAAPSLYSKDDVVGDPRDVSDQRTLPFSIASLRHTLISLQAAESDYSDEFPRTLAALESKRVESPQALSPVDARRRAVLSVGGGTSTGPNRGSITAFADHARNQRAAARNLITHLSDLHVQLKKGAGDRLYQRAEGVRIRLSQAIVAKAPALSEPSVTFAQVIDLMGKFAKVESAPAGAASAAGGAKAQGGAVPWEVNETTLSGLTNTSRAKLVAFETTQERNLSGAMAAAKRWKELHDKRVSDAVAMASRSNCNEAVVDAAAPIEAAGASAARGAAP